MVSNVYSSTPTPSDRSRLERSAALAAVPLHSRTSGLQGSSLHFGSMAGSASLGGSNDVPSDVAGPSSLVQQHSNDNGTLAPAGRNLRETTTIAGASMNRPSMSSMRASSDAFDVGTSSNRPSISSMKGSYQMPPAAGNNRLTAFSTTSSTLAKQLAPGRTLLSSPSPPSGQNMMVTDAKTATAAVVDTGEEAARGTTASLEQLIKRLSVSLDRREQVLREQAVQQKDRDVPFTSFERSEKLQQDASDSRALAKTQPPAPAGPEWPRFRRRPPFAWQPSQDFQNEFEVSGSYNEVVTKIRDYKDRDWVIPVAGTLRLAKGGVYRWTLCIEHKCQSRPQMHLGVHGQNHRRPWRLLTTSRCSRARDDGAWSACPSGDRAIEEGDLVHVEVDLRGLHFPFGTLEISINGEPPEVIFDDIPLSSSSSPIIPVVSMGGDQSRVRLCPVY